MARRRERDSDGNGRADIHLTLDFERAAHDFDEFLGQRQAKAGAFIFAAERAIHLTEG